MSSKSRSLALAGALAPFILSCAERYTGPFRDPNAPVIPPFADSAFGLGATKWFVARSFDSVMAAALDAQSMYTVEAKGATLSLTAVNITNGAFRWTKAVPALSYNIVSVAGVVAAVGQGVVAFDATTGADKFTYAPAGGRSVTSNGATDGSVIVVGNRAGEIVGLNPATGAESWAVPLDTAPVKAVTVSGGVVYAGGNGFLAAVTIATGAQKWKRVTTDNPRPNPLFVPAVDSNRVTIPTLTGGSAGMATYNATTGVLSWSKAGSYVTQPGEAPGQAACNGIIATYTPTGLEALGFANGAALWSKGLTGFNLLSASCAFGTLQVNVRYGAAGAWYNTVEILGASTSTLVAKYPLAATQQLRIHRVLRNASAIYFVTATGVSAILAP